MTHHQEAYSIVIDQTYDNMVKDRRESTIRIRKNKNNKNKNLRWMEKNSAISNTVEDLDNIWFSYIADKHY